MSILVEEWRTVPGFPNYEVSNFGNVKSLLRTVRCVRYGIEGFRTVREKILKKIPHRGYLVAKLGHPDLTFGIHQLVAWAWIGPQAEDMTVNHKDGDKHNNTPGNLEYLTSADNAKHAHRTGLMDGVQAKGEDHCYAKLTEMNVREILTSTLSNIKLAEQFGCSASAISLVRLRKNWKHVII